MTATSANRAVRLAIWDALHSPECQRLDFRYRGCVVNGRAYRRVALGAWHGHIDVRLREYGTGAGSAAQYDDDENAILHQTAFLTSGSAAQDAVDRATCVHEMTHAVYDAHNLGKRPGEESEIIAYVAEYVFRIHAGLPLSTETPVARAAGAIARFMGGRPGFDLTDGLVGGLRQAILAAPIYAELTRRGCWSNGIPNVRLD